jgi:hypothetical protein
LHQLCSFPDVTMMRSMLPIELCFKRKLGFRERFFSAVRE